MNLPEERMEEEARLPSVLSQENRELLEDIHITEDRIDIAQMEVEDLEEACLSLTEEVEKLKHRLKESTMYGDASDHRLPEHPPVPALESTQDVPEGTAENTEAGTGKDGAGDAADESPENTGGEDSAPEDLHLEEEKTGQEEEKKKKKHFFHKKEKTGVLVYQAEQALSSEDWVNAGGDDVLDPFSALDDEDRHEIPDEVRVPEMRMPETTFSLKERTSEKKPAEKKTEEKKTEDKRWKIAGKGRKRKRSAGDPEKIYCPVCGFHVGEDIYCKKCGTKVK